jgi:hypothetical protein
MIPAIKNRRKAKRKGETESRDHFKTGVVIPHRIDAVVRAISAWERWL